MLYINFEKYKRQTLRPKQRQFLQQILPMCPWVQQQTLAKAWYRNQSSPSGVYSSVIAAHIIIKSEWNTHPVSKEKFLAGKRLVYANNLALLPAEPHWNQETVFYDGVDYKCFSDLNKFFIHLSDILGWCGGFDKVLAEYYIEMQIKQMARIEGRNGFYKQEMARLIRELGLYEFDREGRGEWQQSKRPPKR